MLKLVNGFDRAGDADLGIRSSEVVLAMTDNPNFPTPSPTVAEGSTIMGNFFTALGECKDGDRQKIAVKNQARKVLIDMLHKWGLYVLLESGEDVAKAMTSGYQVAKAPSPAPPVTKPLAPVLESGINGGEIVSKGKRQAGALVYLHQYATEAEMLAGHWASQPCSKATCVLSNLTPGVLYYCRIAIVARKEQLVYSDVVSRIAA